MHSRTLMVLVLFGWAFACGGPESPPADAPSAAPLAAAPVVVDSPSTRALDTLPHGQGWRALSADTTAHWNPMGEDLQRYAVEVAVGGRLDTLRGIIQLDLLQVTDSVVTAVGVEATQDDADRLIIVLRPDGVRRFPLPPDVYYNYHDLAVSPDGRHLAYVAAQTEPYGLAAVVRDLETGAEVFRSRLTAKCDCDIDFNHAQWRSADSVDVAVDDTKGPERGWLVASVRLRPFSAVTRVVASEPAWHSPR